MATEEQAKVRRIVDLDVKEVSLVDRPAIRRTFLVIKREEEEPMGAFAPEKDEIRKTAETEDEEKKKAGKGKDESACKDEDEEETEKKKAVPPEDEEEKKKAKPDEEEEMTKGAMNPKALAGMISSIKGAPKDAVDKLVAFLESKSKAAPAEDEYPSPKTKSENLVVVKADGSVEINAEVTKGRKMLTQQRSNMIKDTIISLARVLQEADEETSKAMIEEMKALPSNSSISSAVQPVGPKGKTKAEKEEEDEVEKLKGEVTKLTKRLEEIEGTRQVSKSASEEGTDEKKAVQKSLWSGVL
jgi:hypothetical protein